jgi:hypothetical protein
MSLTVFKRYQDYRDSSSRLVRVVFQGGVRYMTAIICAVIFSIQYVLCWRASSSCFCGQYIDYVCGAGRLCVLSAHLTNFVNLGKVSYDEMMDVCVAIRWGCSNEKTDVSCQTTTCPPQYVGIPCAFQSARKWPGNGWDNIADISISSSSVQPNEFLAWTWLIMLQSLYAMSECISSLT